MIRNIRSTLIGLALVASLVLSASLVGATTGATASATLNGGVLAFTALPADFSYPTTTLNGDVQNLSSSFQAGVNDPTGTGAGWNITATIGTLTSGSNTIASSAHTIQSAPITHVTGVDPTNNITYPRAIPTDGSKIFSANATTGKGKTSITFNTQLAVPADAAAGTYTATMTVSLNSGP